MNDRHGLFVHFYGGSTRNDDISVPVDMEYNVAVVGGIFNKIWESSGR